MNEHPVKLNLLGDFNPPSKALENKNLSSAFLTLWVGQISTLESASKRVANMRSVHDFLAFMYTH